MTKKNSVADFLDTDAVYFTTRKTSDGWIAEKLYFDNGDLVREKIGDAGGRAHALETFKRAVAHYWAFQYRTKL